MTLDERFQSAHTITDPTKRELAFAIVQIEWEIQSITKTRGFELTSTGIGTHLPIDDLLEELDDASESPCEYTLFHNTIVRIPDAWSRDAEVIHLE